MEINSNDVHQALKKKYGKEDLSKSTIYVLARPNSQVIFDFDIISEKIQKTTPIPTGFISLDLAINALSKNDTYRSLSQNLNAMYGNFVNTISIRIHINQSFFDFDENNILNYILIEQINIGDKLTLYPNITDISFGQILNNIQTRPILSSFRYDKLSADIEIINSYSENFDVIKVG